MADEPLIITPEQSRAGRALLDWSQEELARRASLSQSTVRDFEKGRRVPAPNNLKAILQALLDAGVRLVADGYNGGAGVRFAEATAEAAQRAKIWRIESRIYRDLVRLRESEQALRYYALTPAPTNTIAAHFASKINYAQRDIERMNEDIEKHLLEMSETVGRPIKDKNELLESIFNHYAAQEGNTEASELRDVRLIDLDDYKDLRERLMGKTDASAPAPSPFGEGPRQLDLDADDDEK